MCKQLHERLRLAREQRGLSLAAIARERGVREQTLILIDQNAFEELPTGLYGRHAIRSYACAVGIPADEALAEVQARLREPEDPMNGLARVRGLERPQPRKEIDASVARAAGRLFVWWPQVAALIDAAFLVAMDLALLELTALAAGVGAADVLRIALPALVLLFALIAGLYFVLLGNIRRATFGTQLVQALEACDLPQVIWCKLLGLRFRVQGSWFGSLVKGLSR
jgi:transcriptional regulator with XRE-family HTH domain